MPAENDFRRMLREHARATRVGKFGQFEFQLGKNRGLPSGQVPIAPGDSEVFTFEITPAGAPGTVVAEDFTSEVSSVPPGNTPSRAAAKFINGPNDDSAFGATQTDPASGLLTLSEQSNGSTPAANLGATLDFSVGIGVRGDLTTFDELTLVVTNNSALPNAFSIQEIYWNASDNVDGLRHRNAPQGWAFVSSI